MLFSFFGFILLHPLKFQELWEQLKVYGESGITGQSPARWPNTCLPYLPKSVGRIKNEDGFDADFWYFSDTKVRISSQKMDESRNILFLIHKIKGIFQT